MQEHQDDDGDQNGRLGDGAVDLVDGVRDELGRVVDDAVFEAWREQFRLFLHDRLDLFGGFQRVRAGARENAERAWAKLKPDTALQVQMIAALEAQKKTPKWLENGGEFIPHPATWINGKRWLDELKPKIEQPKRLAI